MPIEERLVQVHMKSTEGNLAFPNELNEMLYSLFFSVDASDTAPTESVKSVYATLSKQLDAELAKWKAVASSDVPALDRKVRDLSLPALSVPGSQPPSASGGSR